MDGRARTSSSHSKTLDRLLGSQVATSVGMLALYLRAMRLRWWLSSVVLWLGCASSLPKLALEGLPDAKEHPDARWVVLLDEEEARFEPGKDGPEVVTTTRWRIKVLKPTDVPALSIGYSRTFTTIESVRGRVIAPDGKETPLDDEKRFDFPGFDGSVLFTDSRVLHVPVPPVPVGGVFEYEVVKRRRDMQHFSVGTTFGNSEPTERARLVVSAPRDWTVGWKVRHDDGKLAPTITETADRRTWTFAREKLPGVEREPEGPPASARVPEVIARLERWVHAGQRQQSPATPEELSRQLAARYAEAATTTPELEAAVKEALTGVEDTPEAKARALYEYACRRVQYCAIEIGLGGWYPHAAKDVHATRYGDCKDKATYLHALLTLAGVRSAPTLIYAHDGTPRDFAVPSLGANFNHAILAVFLPGDRVVFADPTHRAVPFGELPTSDQGAPVLPVTAEGAPLTTTPESPASLNVERQRFTFTLQPDGEATGQFQLETAGARAQPWKHKWLEGTGSARRFIEERLWLKAPLVRDARRVTEGDFSPTVELRGELVARRVASALAGDRLAVRPLDLFSPWFQQYGEGRASAVVSPTRETRVAEVVFQLPPGQVLLSPPREVKVEGPSGTYRLSAHVDGARLTLTRSFERTQRLLPPSAVADFNRFAAAVFAAEAEPLVLGAKGGAR